MKKNINSIYILYLFILKIMYNPTPTPTPPQIATIIFKNYTAADWITDNPILFIGEFGYENDTGKLKVGDGSTEWRLLPYICSRAISNCNTWDLTPAPTPTPTPPGFTFPPTPTPSPTGGTLFA